VRTDFSIRKGNRIVWYDQERKTNVVATVLYKVYWSLRETMLLKVKTASGDVYWVREEQCHLFIE